MSLLKHCADGNLAEIKNILEHTKGIRNKVQVRDNHNWSCLHHAVKSGSVECIKFLLTIKELSTTAETFEGETALHIACSIPNISLEIISILIEAKADLLNYVNNEEVDILKCAINGNRLDIIKLAIANGAPVNNQDLDGDTALHIAAIQVQLDVIRYLIYEAHCDPTICNEKGNAACFLLFAKLLQKLMLNSSLSTEEIDCFEELAQFTYNLHDINNPNESEVELNQMIDLGYRHNYPRSSLYTGILKLFHVPSSKKYFFQKILQSNVSSCHCLIVALIEDTNIDHFDQTYMKYEIWPDFLLELFKLFLSDESFFNEYMSEIMSSGWSCSQGNQVINFCEFITQGENSLQPQKLFSFLKVLILYEINFNTFMRGCEVLMPNLTLTVFVPLAKYVIPSFPLGLDFLVRNYNFNESGDVLHDSKRAKDFKIGYEVVSLKNICRMSIRHYYFRTYSHYTALKALYSSHIPIRLRNFLCYNDLNLEF